MTYEQLTAEQALEIASLKEKLEGLENDRHAVRNVLFCIGGPLNDNRLGFNAAQLKPFWQISQLTEMLEAQS